MDLFSLLYLARSGHILLIFWVVDVGYIHRVYWNKEVHRPVLSDLLQVLLHQLIVGLELFLVFVGAHYDVNKISICAKLHQRP